MLRMAREGWKPVRASACVPYHSRRHRLSLAALPDLLPGSYLAASQQRVDGARRWLGARSDVSSDPGHGPSRVPIVSWCAGCRAALDRNVGCWQWWSGAAREWASSERRGRRRRRLLAGAGRLPRSRTGPCYRLGRSVRRALTTSGVVLSSLLPTVFALQTG